MTNPPGFSPNTPPLASFRSGIFLNRRHLSPEAYQKICLVNLVLVSLIIVTGAAVRLTGSGLGCPDWPTCEGMKVLDPSSYHAAIESGNRALTGLVSLGVIVATLGALVRVPGRRDLFWLSIGLVGGILVQIVVGALVVILELDPISVIVHFLASILLVWCAVVLLFQSHRLDIPLAGTEVDETEGNSDGRETRFTHGPAPLQGFRSSSSRQAVLVWTLVRLIFLLASILLVLGTMVTGSGPHAGDELADRLGYVLRDVTRIHSLAAWVLTGVLLLLAWIVRKGKDPVIVGVRSSLFWLGGAVVFQMAVGYAQYAMELPPLLVGVHVVGATLVWIATVFLNLRVPQRSVVTD